MRLKSDRDMLAKLYETFGWAWNRTPDGFRVYAITNARPGGPATYSVPVIEVEEFYKEALTNPSRNAMDKWIIE